MWLLPFGILLLVTAVGLLLPMLFGRSAPSPSRAERACVVLRDKLTQAARDREVGLIDPEEAIGVEAEISRALIASNREVEIESAGSPPGRGGWAGIALIATLSLGGSVELYRLIGSYDLPDQPLAARDIGPEEAAPTLLSEHDGSPMNDAIISLQARLEQDPGNAEQWLLLARSYAAVGADAESAAAYARLIELAPAATELQGDFAEALVRAEDGLVGPLAVTGFEAVLAHTPDDPRALYYIALRDAQNGEPLRAAQGWVGILQTAPADAPYQSTIREILDAVIRDANLDRAALDIPTEPAPVAMPGPSAEDIAAAAALPGDQQMEMIRGMVAQLEARLEDESGDIEGWLRLARSRMVLGEPEAGVAALERALATNPGDPNLQSALVNMRVAATQ